MVDLIPALQFWLASLALSVAAWPVSRRVFASSPDQGWAFSRTLGLLFAAYVVWLLATLNLAPISATTVIFAVVGLAGGSWWFFRADRPLKRLAQNKAWVFTELTLYSVVFGLWTYMRGFNPDIIGLEKFMDFGFMNSILRGQVIPPLNHFLAGEPINYYYYGHYLSAFYKLLSFTETTTSYNLQMSHLLAAGSTHASMLGAWIYKRLSPSTTETDSMAKVAGFFSMLFVFFVGNFQYIWHLLTSEKPDYWYPNATRYIEATIHEFPLYSFLVNDLHGHVVDIPSSMLAFGLAMVLYDRLRENSIQSRQSEWFLRNPSIGSVVFLQAFIVGGCYFTNAWNYPIYLLLTGLLAWVALGQSDRHPIALFFESHTLKNVFSISVLLVALSVLAFLPHWLTFVPISQGIRVVPAEKSSPLTQYLVLWVLHTTPCLLLWREVRRPGSPIPISMRWLLGAVLALVFLLMLYPEFFYMKDIYPGHIRANTMFKFFYQAWVWAGILGGASLIYLINQARSSGSRLEWFYFSLTVFMLSAGLAYTGVATRQHFDFKKDRSSVIGTQFLKQRFSDDFDAIAWFNENVRGQPFILESAGESYTENARISTFTGLPTLINWPVHVWLWNGSFDKPIIPTTHVERRDQVRDTVAGRVETAKQIYETTDPELALQLLRRYSIKYVIVGSLERQKYPGISVEKFKRIGKVAFESGSTQVFEVKD